jgi:hypothetical protein
MGSGYDFGAFLTSLSAAEWGADEFYENDNQSDPNLREPQLSYEGTKTKECPIATEFPSRAEVIGTFVLFRAHAAPRFPIISVIGCPLSNR